jgi:TonB family protein
MDSTARQQRIFYILFGAMLFAHAALMLTKIDGGIFSKTAMTIPTTKVMKVSLVKRALHDMAMSQRKQIAQSEDSDSAEKKKDAFLSDKDRSFDRQTVSKNTDIFKKAGAGNATVTQKAQPKMEAAPPKEKVDFKNIKLSDIGLTASQPNPFKQPRAPAEETIKGMKNADPLSQGLSATNDYVEEVALGDFTHLNTVEYKFYGFYHRIRQKLEQFWGRSIQEKAANIFRAGRRLPASENLITSLQVTLNENGEIVAVKILGASGVKELDDAAIESFNEAGPFPNPPKELLVNGKATIDWGFVVKS